VVLMAVDPLDEVLRLVAEGRLTAEEAAPILAALDERPGTGASAAGGTGTRGGQGPGGVGAGFGTGFESGFGTGAGGAAGSGTAESTASYGSTPGSGGGSLRVEVREAGRQVVNLRLPIAVGRLALERVPGLSGEQVESVKEALRSGLRGPILEVEDGVNSVRIVVD
jgi:hypothetical protein